MVKAGDGEQRGAGHCPPPEDTPLGVTLQWKEPGTPSQETFSCVTLDTVLNLRVSVSLPPPEHHKEEEM